MKTKLQTIENIIGWTVVIGFISAIIIYIALDISKPKEQHYKEVKHRREHPNQYVRPIWEP